VLASLVALVATKSTTTAAATTSNISSYTSSSHINALIALTALLLAVLALSKTLLAALVVAVTVFICLVTRQTKDAVLPCELYNYSFINDFSSLRIWSGAINIASNLNTTM
jgi:uncharacterized membrane protein